MQLFSEFKDEYGCYDLYKKGEGEVKFSFLISAFNSEATIITSLQSILDQSVKNYELVLIDDGSCDRTRSLIFDILESFENYIFITQSNIGLTKSLNRGLLHSRGEWVVRSDADDINKEFRLARLNLILDSKCNFYTARAEYLIDGKSKSIKPRNIYMRGGFVTKSALIFGNPFVHGTFVAKKDVLIKYMYNSKFKYSQDYELLVRLVVSKERVKCIPEVHYEFHQNDGSIGQNFSDQQADFARRSLVDNGVFSSLVIVQYQNKAIRYLLRGIREAMFRLNFI